jgi:hypothetical protein
MTSIPGAVKRCTRILWPGKALEKTPRGVIPPVCDKYRKTLLEKKAQYYLCVNSFLAERGRLRQDPPRDAEQGHLLDDRLHLVEPGRAGGKQVQQGHE